MKFVLEKMLGCLPVVAIAVAASVSPKTVSANINLGGNIYLQDSSSNTYQILLLDENEQQIENAKIRLKTKSADGQELGPINGTFTVIGKAGDIIEVIINRTVVKVHTLGGKKDILIQLSSKNNSVARSKEVRLLNNISAPSHLTATSTQAVYTNDLIKMPVTSVKTALAGRLAGVYTNQSSGQPGSDGVSLSLRGREPLVIIDGIPRNLTVFDLDEIESVTVLKDALSTAMLGVRGNNGALLITTKKGSESKQRISFTAQTAVQKPLKMLQTLRAYDYATLYNEALRNDPVLNQGITPYSDASLQAYQTGSDPFTYPDVNWMGQVLEPSSRFDRYTLNTTGGGKFGKYFVGLEHFNQTGLFKTSDINTYNTNNSFKSYVIRSNVDVTINSKLSAGVHLFGRILDGTEPGRSTGTILSAITTTPNNAYPVYNPDGSYAGTQQFQNNIWAQTINSGYRMNYKRDMMADFYLKRVLDDLVKGLWIKATGSFYATISESVFRDKNFASFQRIAGPSGDTYSQFNTNSIQANSNFVEYQNRADYMELSLGYNRTFGNNGFDAVLLANRDNSVNQDELPYTISGFSGRMAYNYKQKYVAEVAFGYNGSNRYAPEGSTKRGFFPAFGLAWNIDKEAFLANNPFISQLKLFASYGKTGWDNPGYFTYNQYYFDGGGYYFGSGAGTNNTSIGEQVLANTNITWEKADKFNVGVQGGLFKNALSYTVEYYNNKYSDLLIQRGINSGLIGNVYPNENIGKNRYSGWDFQLGWQQGKKDFNYFLNLNAGLQKSEVLFMDEVSRPFARMAQTGTNVGARFGYQALGLYQTGESLNGAAFIEGYNAQPGDIKYRDFNNDGIINYLDRTQISTDKPLLTYGLNLGFKFKWVDFSALIQGVENRDLYLSGNTEWEFQNNGLGQAFAHHLNRWTPQNTNADYPRLTVGTNPNNHVESSFWMHSGDYLRLKNIELGFTIPAALTNKVRLESVRLFVNGTNLFTRAEYDRVDPEVYGGAYPIQKLINMGVNVKL